MFKIDRVKDWEGKNTNNFHEFSPFGVLENSSVIEVIDYFWNHDLIETVREHFKEIAINNKYELIIKSDLSDGLIKNLKNTIFACLYQAYIKQYHYDNFYREVSDYLIGTPNVFRLTDDDMEILKVLCVHKFEGNSDEEIMNKYSQIGPLSFSKDVRKLFQQEIEFFVKLSCYSSKHDYDIQPIDNMTDLVLHLSRSKKFYSAYTKKEWVSFNFSISVILVPWVNKLKHRDEFRVFVKNKKITAITQQSWWIDHCFSNNTIIEIGNKIKNLVNNISNKLPFRSVVLDVIVIGDECKLIECNSYGSFAASGGSLFCWKKDKNILEKENQSDEIVFRVLTLDSN